MRSAISWMPMSQELTEGCRRSACTREMCCSFCSSMTLWIFCTTADRVTSWASEGNALDKAAPTPAPPERARNSLRVSFMGRLLSDTAPSLILLVGQRGHPVTSRSLGTASASYLLMVYLPKEKILDVERIAPIHGTVVPMTDLKTAIGQATD